jgi:hypothetical protein
VEADRPNGYDSFPEAPWLTALREPASPSELVGAQDVLEAYRRHGGRVAATSRWNLRVGLCSTTIGAALVLSGGVAAAYTAHLPAPLQRAAHGLHHMLGPIAPPSPDEDRQSRSKGPVPRKARPSAAPGEGSGEPAQLEPGLPGRPPDAARVPPPAKSTRTVILTLTSPASSVPVHATVSINGALSDGTAALPGKAVDLQIRTRPTQPFRTVQIKATDPRGHVDFRTSRLSATTEVRLYDPQDRRTTSSARIIVTPTITLARVSTDSSGRQVFHVSVDGGRPGEVVSLRTAGSRTVLQRAALKQDSTADLAVPRTNSGQQYLVSLTGNDTHGEAKLAFRA